MDQNLLIGITGLAGVIVLGALIAFFGAGGIKASRNQIETKELIKEEE